MSLKIKRMCGVSSSDIKNNFEDYVEIVKKVKYVCLKCGRVSSKKKFLCNPEKIKK